LNPEFIKSIEVFYYFEEDQTLKVAAYDADEFGNPNLSIDKANYIGEAEFKLQQLVSQRTKSFQVLLNNLLPIGFKFAI
jgi:predicted RNA-binding protein with RPS1 domain